ncbi:hypothetical protein MRX96_052568 [Rhipicephalus microplus]
MRQYAEAASGLRRCALARSFRHPQRSGGRPSERSYSKWLPPTVAVSRRRPWSHRTLLKQKMQPAKKPRRCFSAHEDLCILREVAAAKPFGDDIKWVHVLAAVNRAVGRELTLRGIKDRVDILLGYWKLQNSKPPNWHSTTTHKTTPPQHVQPRVVINVVQKVEEVVLDVPEHFVRQ